MNQENPVNLLQWIEQNRSQLKPPVGNKDIWKSDDFMITVVGGPNRRKDYHLNETEEIFYQIEGEVTIKVIEEGKFKDIPLRAGELYLLPPNTPHSPVRPAGTVGMVIERKRLPTQIDGFAWYCETCQTKLWEVRQYIHSIVTDFPAIFDRFYGDSTKCTCSHCGRRQEP